MKKRMGIIFVSTILTMAMLLSGCSGKTPNGTSENASPDNGIASIDDGVTKICLLINGNLGDMSFFDSANAGMVKFAEDHPDVEVKVVEMGADNTKWEPTLRQTANEAYDLIIVGTTDMREPLQRLVRNSKYSDRRFIIFDTEIEDNASENYPTVHSIQFKQNEGGYLAGALAAMLSKEQGVANTGFIGGMKIDIINDFGFGFMQGVERVNADYSSNILAYNSYIGDFTNSPKGKSLADTMYQEGGASILFAAASQAGLGCLDSAKNNDRLIIGVDSDQYEYFADVDSEKAEKIVTSVLKRVDLALYEACEAFLDGSLSYGDLDYLGIKEGKIGIVDNEIYQTLVSQEIRDYINKLQTEIVNGTIQVESGLKRYTSTENLNAKYDLLDPNKQ